MDTAFMNTRFVDLPFSFSAFSKAFLKECISMQGHVEEEYPNVYEDWVEIIESFEDEDCLGEMMIAHIEETSDTRKNHTKSPDYNLNTFLDMLIPEINGMGLDDKFILVAMERAFVSVSRVSGV
jgi:hypothetical protein